MTSNYLRKGDSISNRYQIHDVFLGGMSVVYVVYDRQLQEALALKTFRDDLFARHPSIAKRFENEARTWIRIEDHPNVTRAFELVYSNARPLLIIEYVCGGDLAR